MKEWYFNFLGLTLVIALPDGSDGWLWRSEFEPPKKRHIQTSLFCVRIVESYTGWVGVEFVFLILVVLLKWNAPNNASSGLVDGRTEKPAKVTKSKKATPAASR